MLHSFYDQPDATAVHARFDRILDTLADKLPKVAAHLETARADVLASPPSYPTCGARSGRTTRRNDSTARSAGAPTSSTSSPTPTPSSDSSGPGRTTRRWAEGRRYLGLDALNRSRLTLIPATDPHTEEFNTLIRALSA